jgi:hopene-associated glycosyltransferase HpnB
MHLVGIVAGALSALTWIYLLLGRGRFWLTSPLPQISTRAEARIAVIIPARDEAGVVAQAVSSLLRQSHAGPIHIVLIDDGSRDGTARVAREAAESVNRGSQLTVLEGKPLPPGWSGKLWAVHQGIEAARPLDPSFFLLTDADIVHAPGTISSLVARAEADNYDLVSYMVKLHCRKDAEKLLVPAFVFFFFMLYPPAWIADPRRKIAGAAGGCILIRPEALTKAGGIEAVRDQIIDDCALARAVKKNGGRIWLGATGSSLSIRPYRSAFDIGRMISRSAFNQLQHSTVLLLMALLGMVVIYMVPVVLLFTERIPLVVLGAVLWFGMSVAYLPTIMLYSLNSLWALTLPLAAVFYMGATMHSAIQYWLGRGGEWKGRVHDPAKSRVAG